MDTNIRSALNHIKVDDVLISKTEVYLRNELAKNRNHKVIKTTGYRLNFIKYLVKVTCIVLILIESSVGRFTYYKTPISYISLDINPSIEFGVNMFDQVVTVKGYNNDGRRVLTGLNLTGTNVTTAISTVISSVERDGFIAGDGSTVISVTSETDDIKTAGKLENEAETGVNEALEDKGRTAVIVKDNVCLSFRDEATELNIAPGKLNLIKKLQAVNPAVTVNQYKDAKVTEIVEAMQRYAGDNYSKEVAVNSVSKNDLNTKKESDAVNIDKNAVQSKGENTESSKDQSTATSEGVSIANSIGSNIVISKDKNDVKNKGQDVYESKENSVVKNKVENDYDNKAKDAVKSKDGETERGRNGQVNSSKKAAAGKKQQEDRGNSTKNDSDKGSHSVKEWLENRNTEKAAKFSKK